MTKNKSSEFKVNCMQPYKEQGGALGPSVLITWQKEGDQFEWVNGYKKSELISEAEFIARGGKIYKDPKQSKHD